MGQHGGRPSHEKRTSAKLASPYLSQTCRDSAPPSPRRRFTISLTPISNLFLPSRTLCLCGESPPPFGVRGRVPSAVGLLNF